MITGYDHTVSDVTVVSPTEITANVTVDADATLSARSVWVELPGTGPGLAAGRVECVRFLRHCELNQAASPGSSAMESWDSRCCGSVVNAVPTPKFSG